MTDRESVRTANDVRNLIHDTNDSRRTRFGHRKSQTERNVTLSSVSGPFLTVQLLLNRILDIWEMSIAHLDHYSCLQSISKPTALSPDTEERHPPKCRLWSLTYLSKTWVCHSIACQCTLRPMACFTKLSWRDENHERNET